MPSSATLQRACAIVQACSGTTSQTLAFGEIITRLKELNEKDSWPFEYIQKYPRDPHELPEEVLDYACGPGVRPVPPPAPIKVFFRLIVNKILTPLPAESAQQVRGKWKSHQGWDYVAKCRAQFRWFPSASGAKRKPSAKQRPHPPTPTKSVGNGSPTRHAELAHQLRGTWKSHQSRIKGEPVSGRRVRMHWFESAKADDLDCKAAGDSD